MGPKLLSNPPPASRILSSRKVYPATTSLGKRKTTRLSIIDATVARFSPCAAVWLYDADEAARDTDLLLAHLQQTLCETLDDYPHFAGQLRWATDAREPSKVGRPMVVYGAEDEDPGVEFTVAAYDCPLAELVPSEEDRQGDKQVWIASDFPQDELLPKAELAFASRLDRFEGLPGASAQVTTFACGGFAVGIKITHCLSDAVCLVQFAKNWAHRARASFSSQRSRQDDARGDVDDDVVGAAGREAKGMPGALFDPSLLDGHAGIATTTTTTTTMTTQEHDAKLQLARSLPMHRYDWWKTDAPGYPSWATASSEATKPSPAQLRDNIGPLSPSTAPPWTTWDPSAPVDHAQIRFSHQEVRRMQEEAAQAELLLLLLPRRDSSSPPRRTISRLDALIAHLWILIQRARQAELGAASAASEADADADVAAPVYLDMTLGLRTRVAPPLPDNFVGSPILLAHISRPSGGQVAAAVATSSSSSSSSSSSLGGVALSIRETMAQFTPEAVSAYLYDAAHEPSPQRLWQAFLGRRHTLVTSWTKAGCYEVDFVGGRRRPRYVQGRMPRMDGCLQVMDVGEGGQDFDVSLCLERGALRRLVEDERLRAYER